jgi:hypothetical protein
MCKVLRPVLPRRRLMRRKCGAENVYAQQPGPEPIARTRALLFLTPGSTPGVPVAIRCASIDITCNGGTWLGIHST